MKYMGIFLTCVVVCTVLAGLVEYQFGPMNNKDGVLSLMGAVGGSMAGAFFSVMQAAIDEEKQ